MTAKHWYVFCSHDKHHVYTSVYINKAETLREARSDAAWLRKQGCPVRPIVRVPLPALRAKERGE